MSELSDVSHVMFVHDDVSVFVFNPDSSCWVTRLLPPVGVDGLHGAVRILSPLVVGRVNLPLARVKVDLFGAVPEKHTHTHDQLVFVVCQKYFWRCVFTHGLTCMTVPSVSTLSSRPFGKRFLMV